MIPAVPPDKGWLQAERVLLVRLDNLGDVLMTTPAMAAVRRSLPNARLTLLASRSGAAAVPHLPMLDDAIVYQAPWVQGGEHDVSGEADRRLLERVVAERYDAAIIFTVATQSALPAALLCRQAGIPLCLGHSRENPYRLMSHWVSEPDTVQPGMRHEVQRQLDLVDHVGYAAVAQPLTFAVRSHDKTTARRKLAQAIGGDPGRYVLVHPGATATSRRYSASAFGQAAAQISASGLAVVFLGGPAEAGLIDEAVASMRAAGVGQAVVLPSDLSLGELAALIAEAAVLVANNSAPAHLAAAVGTPVVDLYALTNPQHTPWMARSTVLSHDVPCRNCLRSVCPMGHHHCLTKISPGAVAEATLRWIDSSINAAPCRAIVQEVSTS